MENNVLLESGTGELEIIEFIVSGVHYAINVVKVKEVIEMDSKTLTEIPNAKPELAGLMLCRSEVITLVDLKYVLTKVKNNMGSKVIICEFNKVKVAFNIDDIIAIRRIKWGEINKPDDISDSSLDVGNIVIKDKVIIMLDFEKIVTDISPKTGISEDRLVRVEYKDRANIRLAIADDSPLIRRLLKDTLNKAGFRNLLVFDDGKQALDYLLDLAKRKEKDFISEVQLLITDIEMPQMDGLTLTRKIKEDPVLKYLPVIIFSSLITNELRHKGESVGADAQLSKPEVEELIGVVDRLLEVK